MKRVTTWFLGRSDLVEPLIWLQRRETWYADFKTNSIRLLTLFVFTVAEFISYSLLHAVTRSFHIIVVLILLLWWAAAGLSYWAVSRHLLSRRLPYLMVAVDLVLLTALLILGQGTQSSLIVIYFLIIALSGIRLNPMLCLYSAAGSCIGYLSVVILTGGNGIPLKQTVLYATVVPLALALMGIIMSSWIQRVLLILNDSMKESSL